MEYWTILNLLEIWSKLDFLVKLNDVMFKVIKCNLTDALKSISFTGKILPEKQIYYYYYHQYIEK